jgi:predicted extracellular nuclease
LLGDFNDVPASRAIRTLERTGLRNLHADIAREAAYTHVFEGSSQTLDYVFVSQELDVAGYGPAHVNVDFGTGDPARPESSHRVSDHDPPVVTLRLPGAALLVPAANAGP